MPGQTVGFLYDCAVNCFLLLPLYWWRDSDRSRRSSLKFPPRPKREKKEEKEIVQTKKIERKLEAHYIAAFEREVEEEESAQD